MHIQYISVFVNNMETGVDFFKNKQIEGELHEDKWVNFGFNRTKALNYALTMDENIQNKIVQRGVERALAKLTAYIAISGLMLYVITKFLLLS